MFQIRGLSDDPWANTQPEAETGFEDAGAKIAASFKSMFDTVLPSPTPSVTAVTTTPTPTTKTTTMTPAPTPWYKTKLGIVAIIAGAFAGWKYVLPKFKK